MLARFHANIFTDSKDLVDYYANSVSHEKTIILTENIFKNLILPVQKPDSKFIVISEDLSQKNEYPENIKIVKTVFGSLSEAAKNPNPTNVEIISDENGINKFFPFSYLCDSYLVHENSNDQESELNGNKSKILFLNENCSSSKIVEKTATKKIIKFKYKKIIQNKII